MAVLGEGGVRSGLFWHGACLLLTLPVWDPLSCRAGPQGRLLLLLLRGPSGAKAPVQCNPQRIPNSACLLQYQATQGTLRQVCMAALVATHMHAAGWGHVLEWTALRASSYCNVKSIIQNEVLVGWHRLRSSVVLPYDKDWKN